MHYVTIHCICNIFRIWCAVHILYTLCQYISNLYRVTKMVAKVAAPEKDASTEQQAQDKLRSLLPKEVLEVFDKNFKEFAKVQVRLNIIIKTISCIVFSLSSDWAQKILFIFIVFVNFKVFYLLFITISSLAQFPILRCGELSVVRGNDRWRFSLAPFSSP